MKDDIFSSLALGVITFITPDLRFKLEYCLPHAADSNQRTFDFTWLADLSVNGLALKIQQPTSANSLAVEPSTASVARGEGGFIYYTFPVQNCPGRAVTFSACGVHNDHPSIVSSKLGSAWYKRIRNRITSYIED